MALTQLRTTETPCTGALLIVKLRGDLPAETIDAQSKFQYVRPVSYGWQRFAVSPLVSRLARRVQLLLLNKSTMSISCFF